MKKFTLLGIAAICLWAINANAQDDKLQKLEAKVEAARVKVEKDRSQDFLGR